MRYFVFRLYFALVLNCYPNLPNIISNFSKIKPCITESVTRLGNFLKAYSGKIGKFLAYFFRKEKFFLQHKVF